MSNISRSYPFQPQYNALIDKQAQPEKNTDQEVSEVDKANSESHLTVLDSIDDLIFQMQRDLKKLCEKPAMCELFLELIYVYRTELNKKMLEDQLAFFDSSGELVRKENHEITRRIVQLLDLEAELAQVESQAGESSSLILSPAEKKALMRQLAKSPPIVKFCEAYYSEEDVIDCSDKKMDPPHDVLRGEMTTLVATRAELLGVIKLIEANTPRESQQLFSLAIEKLVNIHEKIDGFISLLQSGREFERKKEKGTLLSVAVNPSGDVSENSKVVFYQSVVELIQRWEVRVTYFNTQYIGLLISLSSLTQRNDKQRFEMDNIEDMVAVLEDISTIKDMMAVILGGVTESDLSHLLDDMGINSGEVAGSIALMNIGSDIANMLKDAMLGCFITLKTTQERQGMMTPEQLASLNNMMVHFERVVKKISSFSSTHTALSQLIKTAGSLLSVLAKLFR